MSTVKALSFSKPPPVAPLSAASNKGVSITNCVYYFWFEYLKRSDEYKTACGKGGEGMDDLYADFGNIYKYKTNDFGYTDETEFWDWWNKRGQFLFGESSVEGSLEFADVKDVMSFQDDIDKGDYKIVLVPTNMKKTDIRKQLNKLVTKMKEREGLGDSSTGAKYKIKNARVDVESLRECLDAYDLHISGMSNRKIFASLNKLTEEENMWAVEDKRGNRGLFEDWEVAGSEDFDSSKDSDEDFKQTKGEVKAERKLEEKAEKAVDKKMKWRIRQGIHSYKSTNEVNRRMTNDEINEMRQLLMSIELGLAKRTEQGKHITARKNYMNTHISRLLKKARANITAVEDGYFPVAH